MRSLRDLPVVFEDGGQAGGDYPRVYMGYDGDYYKLDIRKQDQVYAY